MQLLNPCLKLLTGFLIVTVSALRVFVVSGKFGLNFFNDLFVFDEFDKELI